MRTKQLTILVALVLLAAGCAGNIDPNRQIDDAVLAQRVRDAFAADNVLRDQRIDVGVASGIVSLTGQVRSAADRSRAESLVRSTTGVKDVQNLLSSP